MFSGGYGRLFHVKPKLKGVPMAHFHKVNITYHAPEGDSKVVEMMGATFFDGTPVDVVLTQEDELRVENNPHFQINSSSDYDPGDVPPASRKADAKTDHKAEHHDKADHKR
jgi:hypothetical protein